MKADDEDIFVLSDDIIPNESKKWNNSPLFKPFFSH
jgi:hypothetical protein